MTGAAIVLAFTSALCFGVALVLTHIGLRYIPPLPGAAISIPSSTLLFIAISPIVLGGRPIVWAAVPTFAAIGLLYPATVTLLTLAANRALGPVISGALGNLANHRWPRSGPMARKCPLCSLLAATIISEETI